MGARNVSDSQTRLTNAVHRTVLSVGVVVVVVLIFLFCIFFVCLFVSFINLLLFYFLLLLLLFTSYLDGGWGSWRSWSVCTRTCGGGTETRTRQCDTPTPSDGGIYCIGTGTESNNCNNNICIGKYYRIYFRVCLFLLFVYSPSRRRLGGMGELVHMLHLVWRWYHTQDQTVRHPNTYRWRHILYWKWYIC